MRELMKLFKILKFLYRADTPHFLSVDKKSFFKWRWLILLSVKMNKNYKHCEIYRKQYKHLNNFVVVGLRWQGKNVKRRVSGFAKEFVMVKKDAKCIYCEGKLTLSNCTAEHIVPISKGGNNTQVNLMVCCQPCNSERGNTDFWTYLRMKNPRYKNIDRPFI